MAGAIPARSTGLSIARPSTGRPSTGRPPIVRVTTGLVIKGRPPIAPAAPTAAANADTEPLRGNPDRGGLFVATLLTLLVLPVLPVFYITLCHLRQPTDTAAAA